MDQEREVGLGERWRWSECCGCRGARGRVVKRAHWRVRVEAVQVEGGESKMQVVLCPVRLQAFKAEHSRNAARGFLGT
jgi:hypothetical protein